jgi:hypothetical protein
VNQVLKRMKKGSRRLASAVGVLASIGAVVSLIAGFFWLRLGVHLIFLALPDIVAISGVLVGLWLIYKKVWPHWKPFLLASRFELLVGAAIATLGAVALFGLAWLEFRRIHLLRYEIGPGIVARLENRGEKLEAADAAAEMRRLPLNRRFDSLLSQAERRLRNEAFIEAGLEGNFIKNTSQSSAIASLDMALFGLFLEPSRALYRERVEAARKLWEGDREILQGAARGSEMHRQPTFSAEDIQAYCALVSRCPERIFPSDLHMLTNLRRLRGDEVALRAATAAGVLDTWFHAAGRKGAPQPPPVPGDRGSL